MGYRYSLRTKDDILYQRRWKSAKLKFYNWLIDNGLSDIAVKDEPFNLRHAKLFMKRIQPIYNEPLRVYKSEWSNHISYEISEARTSVCHIRCEKGAFKFSVSDSDLIETRDKLKGELAGINKALLDYESIETKLEKYHQRIEAIQERVFSAFVGEYSEVLTATR